MQREIITKNSKETQALGKLLASKIISTEKRSDLDRLKGGPRKTTIIALEGDLGTGKTTFVQGLLKGLKVAGPFTSPTFLIIKNYQKEIPISKSQFPKKSQKIKSKIQNIYHLDAYRIKAKDILNLGWEEMVAEKNNIIIIEWADRIRKIIPRGALWIKFECVDPPRVDKRSPRVEAGENKRKITFR